MSDKDGKTEKPTSIKLGKAREQGQIAFSSQVASTASLIGSLFVLAWVLSFRGGFENFFAGMLETGITIDDPALLAREAIRDMGTYMLLLVGPILAGAWFGALVGNVIQGRPAYAKKALEPKFEKLNPKEGIKKLKAKLAPFEWIRLFTLLGVLIVAIWNVLDEYWLQVIRSPGVSVEASNALLRTVVIEVLTYVVITLVVLAVVDFFYQKYQHEKGLKMTKSEVKQDNKQMDGSPEMKGKIRSIQQAEAKKRMMTAVEDADVIITNPTHLAIALEYKPDSMAAPRVIAKGQDWLAERIKEKGREYDIPRVENRPLARALYSGVEVGQEIPLTLYKAVAEVLAYVFKVRKGMSRLA